MDHDYDGYEAAPVGAMTKHKPTLYLETSVPSYYTARRSTDMVVLTHQHLTREWWENRIDSYAVYVSEIVYDEIRRGDSEAARRRVESIESFPMLDVTGQAESLAMHYIRELPLPESALADALHLAVASINGLDYLVTWNCRHIARGSVKKKLPQLNDAQGLRSPTICTPEELLYDDQNLD